MTAPVVRAAAAARAAHCCRQHCQDSGPLTGAKRCCLVQGHGDGPAVPAAVPAPQLQPSTLAIVAATPTIPSGWQAVSVSIAAPIDVGPIFLLTRSLRL